jgi:uncharacterized protein YdgA (DUF945 family)
MNKPLAVLVGIVVVAGALNTAGAWYTGSKIEACCRPRFEQTNKELASSNCKARPPTALVSWFRIERNLYSSTAHYRLKLQDDKAGADARAGRIAVCR